GQWMLRSIHCPVLVLQGERDEYGTEAQVRAITAGVAGPACAQLFPGVGHVPHRDVADGVIRVCAEFLHEYAAGG
ncbi:MAG TPA: alpha/beta hydrolase, partial [Myxococcales bacterium]|nr:alpha/beta hydrolase [Myxococcales bacterium]